MIAAMQCGIQTLAIIKILKIDTIVEATRCDAARPLSLARALSLSHSRARSLSCLLIYYTREMAQSVRKEQRASERARERVTER